MSFWYGIKEGLAGFRRARLASAITVFTIAFALLLIGLSAIAAVNLGRLVLELRGRVEIEAFLDPDLTDQQAQELDDRIRKIPGVERVDFVSKESAALEFRQTFGEDVLTILNDNPLPASFRIRPSREYQTSEGARRIARAVEELPGIDEVLYRGDVLRFLDRYTRLAVFLGLLIGGTVALGAVLLTSNTIRLVIMAKSEVIEIMQLVGATRGFVRRPFVIQGMVQGILGGVVGAGCLWLFVWITRLQIPNLIEVDERLYLVVVGMGWLLGYLGSSFAVRKYLK